MKPADTIFVAGHQGLVGSAIVRKLKQQGFNHLLLKTHRELDLLDQAAVQHFFRVHRPNYVFLAAAKVGGIVANNTQGADFLYQNLMIQNNVIHAAYEQGTEKLLFLGSSCIYPKNSPSPISESSLLTGPLEPTNEGYAIAKIAGLKLCELMQRQYQRCFISAMPTNVYGPFDNFHPTNSHVIPGMMRRIHLAKVSSAPSVEIWGTGKVRREFIFSEDLAEALILMMQKYEGLGPVNIGVGCDLAIAELAEAICHSVGYEGTLVFNPAYPDGVYQKLLDSSKILSMGWHPTTTLLEGLKVTYEWATANHAFEQ